MAEPGTEIGAALREARMRARIDIGEVEMRTKIRAKYLRAMENEEWDLLPGPVYVKSFLRTYGEYLGLDSRLLLDEYKRHYELSPETHARPLAAVKRDRERDQRRAQGPRGPRVPSWAIVAAVLVAAGLGLYLIGRGHSNATPKAARGVTVATRPTTTAAALTPTRTTPPGQTTTLAATATLKLVPTASVWICVERPGGIRLINGVVEAPGATLPLLRGRELFVTLGNANVTLTANGRPYPLNASATAIGLKITPQGVSALPQGPTCP
ncbi:MAG TPA: helix-turn-helix domain-containing protein [Solirubrobacteraceae bacterium]|nr:helix-turn-helix domain-containing protein [Solirubrobacteraceae bacterium]